MEIFEGRITKVEPLGGEGGDLWDDGIHDGIRQIIVAYGTVIDSIHVEYVKDGQSVSGVKHGGSGGRKTAKVELEFPDEYLALVTGCYTEYKNVLVIYSLTFHSNKRTFGPFGTEKGHRFAIPTSNSKIVGFHGRSTSFLDAIGAHVKPIKTPKPIQSVGPFGGEGGKEWDDGTFTTIRQIILWTSEEVIESIRIEYDKDGQSVWSPKHGESDGGKLHTIKLDYPDEFLLAIHGNYGEHNGATVVQSIVFQTSEQNMHEFGQLGLKNYFSSAVAPIARIKGFYGRSSLFLDSIGVRMELPPTLYKYESLGPFGGEGGNLWDDGVYTTVRQIIIAAGTVIDSISIEYDKNGQSIWSPKHGESNGGKKHTVKLDYPNEFLILISGHYETYRDKNLIHSLIFQTNKATYGPFGMQKGSEFSIPSNGGKIVGFYGKSGTFIDSIGAHAETILYP